MIEEQETMEEQNFRLHERKRLFSMRTVKHRSRLSRQVVQPPSLPFEDRLDETVSYLISKLALFWTGGWNKHLLRAFPTWIVLWPYDPGCESYSAWFRSSFVSGPLNVCLWRYWDTSHTGNAPVPRDPNLLQNFCNINQNVVKWIR